MNQPNSISPLTLSEAVAWIKVVLDRHHVESDLLKMTFKLDARNMLLPIYAVSHDFVMTTAYEQDPKFSLASRAYRNLSDVERKSAYRSYARGEIFRLHPTFVERLANVGSMKITDCAIHTLTVAYSASKISGWKRTSVEGARAKRWTKTFDSSITPTEEISAITLSDVRVDQTDLEEYFQIRTINQTIVVEEDSHHKDSSALNTHEPNSWVIKVQIEAAKRMLHLREGGADPTKNNILEDLVKWCVTNNVRTTTGIHPSAETIRRHALRKWTPPS